MNILDGNRYCIGTCYYPEHWPEYLWRDDLERMKKVGIEVVRVAEFAWSKVEPTEGVFEYEFFDRFLDLAEEVDMKVIFCTPTATPPAWLTHAYPEVLNANQAGVLYRHGARRHYNYNSPKYRSLTATIVEKFAAHYGQHKSIIGWQIDNELNCEIEEFYSESDTVAFRKYLKDQYGDLHTLNSAWGTTFWNQTYTSFEEIYVPRPTVSQSNNPHHVLDFIRFISESTCNYAKLQEKILRLYIKDDDFITTNGMFSNLDNHRLKEESLDNYMYDSYPNFGYCLDAYNPDPSDLRDRKWSRHLTDVRSINEPFGIMEQQSGANGWNTRMEAPSPRPGQLTLWTMQSVAHGAEYISYFRWRTCTMGTEIYWHGILDYSGRDNRRLSEVQKVHQLFDKIQEVAGSSYEAKVGVVRDYDNIWDAKVDVWQNRMERQSINALFEVSQKNHTPMDYFYINDRTTVEELTNYKVLFYPHPTIVTDERRACLEEYVRQGGTLILGCRSGMKSINGQCVTDLLPGKFRDLTGADVYDYTFIPPDSDTVTIQWDNDTFEAAVFLDFVQESGEGNVVATQVTGDYKGTGALVEHKYGQGKTYYLGTAFSISAVRTFLNRLDVLTPYKTEIEVPEYCELVCRVKGGKRYYFVLNYSKEPVEIALHQEFGNLYTGEKVVESMILQGYETVVLTE